MAIVRKVTVHVPRLTEIVGALDQHGGRPERLEHDDQMRKMEFRFEIQLNGYILFAIFRLPPRLGPRARLRLVDHLANAMVQRRIVGRLFARVAQKAFLLLLQMRNDAEALGTAGAAR